MSRKHLDAHTVAVIRRRHAQGDKLSHLAEHYGISVSCVHNIVKHRTYKNVQDSAADSTGLNLERERSNPVAPTQLSGRYARLAEMRARR
jgi:hypothetical protein